MSVSKEDLVVGAPFFHSPGIGGAIYIYYNSAQVGHCLVFSYNSYEQLFIILFRMAVLEVKF